MTRLLGTRESAREKLEERVRLGKQIKNRAIRSENALAHARKDQHIWSDYNATLLSTLFDDSTFVDEYSRIRITSSITGQDLEYYVNEFRKDIAVNIVRLESILERLELIPEDLNEQSFNKPLSGNKIFIVHGHDDAARESVARFVDKLGIETIILHERPNSGRTIIEKFEHEAADIGFAIILLTPDDVGASATEPDKLKPRARQNVILELGYFIGKLGRSRVCPLYKGELELPSDIFGVVYVPMDSGDGWHLKLARELKAANFAIDPSKIL